MTDFLLPPDLGIAAATPNLDANTASFKSPTVGSTRSVERLGDALRFQLNFTTVNDDPATKRQRGRLQAFLSSLRGQSGRVWMTPPGATLRGSFPATEMFVNNDFSAGVTSWSTDSQYLIRSIDYGIRATRAMASSGSGPIVQPVSLSTGIPYCIRFFINAGKGPIASIFVTDFTDAAGLAGPVTQGMIEAAYAPKVTGSHTVGLNDNQTAVISGNFFDAKWSSFSRCAQVDNGVNLLLNSDTPGTGTGWLVSSVTAASAGQVGPDGTIDSWGITETATTAQHFAVQALTIAAAAADYTYSVFVSQFSSPRGFCWIQIFETLGSTGAGAFLNLSTGAITNITSGANFVVISTAAISYGNGWWRFAITARKTNAATTLQVMTGTATAAGTSSFAGSTGAFLLIWRASLAQSSVPVAPVQTISAAATGTLQTGLQLNIKGLPVSTQGLLLPGDWIECNSQLNQIAAPLDSDGAGLGTAILVRPPRNSPPDSAGFVVNNPMGKFMVSSNSTAWNEMPGRMSDASIELVEDITF